MLIWDGLSDDMKRKLDNWFDSCEKFHLQYIITPPEYSKYFVPAESTFIGVMPPPGFIN